MQIWLKHNRCISGNLSKNIQTHLSEMIRFYVPQQCIHVIATRKLSVSLSGCQTRRLWQNKRTFCPDFYTIWKNIYPSFPTRRTVGERPLLFKILGQTNPNWAKTPIFNRYPCKKWLVVVGGDEPFYLKFCVNRPTLDWNRRFWTDNRSLRLSLNT